MRPLRYLNGRTPSPVPAGARQVLLERGTPVRALVPTLDERADALRELGLEMVASVRKRNQASVRRI